MPLYEYRCDQCGEQFEVRQKFSDEPLTTHEACGGPVQRLISAPSFQFKGSGWYVTDYAKSGKDASGTNTNGDAAKPDSAAKTDKKESAAAAKESGSSASTTSTTESK